MISVISVILIVLESVLMRLHDSKAFVLLLFPCIEIEEPFVSDIAVDSIAVQPCFTLHKWASSEHGNSQLEDNNVHLHERDGFQQSSAEENAEVTVSKNLSGPTDNDQFSKERSKSLSTFGVLISPKLRASQLSFERALDALVEIANMQSSVLYSFHQLHQEVEDN